MSVVGEDLTLNDLEMRTELGQRFDADPFDPTEIVDRAKGSLVAGFEDPACQDRTDTGKLL
jgi:hypothetical protein